MMSRKYLLSILSTLAASSLLFTACGGEDSLQCGAGTVEKSGKCVAETTETPDPIECGAGTKLDADGKKCVANETPEGLTCGTGTVLDTAGKNCIAIDGPPPVTCGDGTELENGICVAEVTCTDDQTAVGGFCLSPAETLAASADAKNIDEPFDLTLPAANEQFIFTGTVDAPTEIDDVLTQNADSFTFEGEAGQWLEITLQSMGLPAPAFKIEAIESDLVYTRFSPQGSAAVARHVVLPITGTYKVTILPEQLVGSDQAGPVGDASWKYVGTLKTLAAPEATDVEITTAAETSGSMSGTFTTLAQNFYKLDGAAQADLISFTVNKAGKNTHGSIMVFSDDGSLIKSFDNVKPDQRIDFVAPQADLYLLVDWIQTNGPLRDYEIDTHIRAKGANIDLDAASSRTITGMTAPANSVIKLTFQSDSTDIITLQILDKNDNPIGMPRPVQSVGRTQEIVDYGFYAEGGEFSVVATNGTAKAHKAVMAIEFIEPTLLDALPANGSYTHPDFSLPARSYSFFLVDSVEQFQVLRFIQNNDEMFYESLVTVTFHDATGKISRDDYLVITHEEDGWGAPVEAFHYAAVGGPLLVQIENFEYTNFDDFNFILDSATPTRLTSTDPDGFKAGDDIQHFETQSLAVGERQWIELTIADALEMTGSLTSNVGNINIIGQNTDFEAVFTKKNPGNEYINTLLLPGKYLFEVVTTTADASNGFEFNASFETQYVTVDGKKAQSSFTKARALTEFPTRINGEADRRFDGTHQYWTLTSPVDIDLIIDLNHLYGPRSMHAIFYETNKSTIQKRTTTPLGTTNNSQFLHVNLEANKTYYLRVGGEDTTTNTDTFGYSIKIAQSMP